MKILYILVFFALFRIVPLHADFVPVQEFIAHPEEPQNKIEFYVLKPNGEGPFPILFLLHGHQEEGKSNGGKQLVELFYLHRLANHNMVAVSISVPGFGNSDGKRDLSGPYSQKAVLAVIDHFKNSPFIDNQRMGIYGISKGAILASMVSVRSSDLSLQVLEAGMYDLHTRLNKLPPYLSALKECLLREAGSSEEAIRERSALFHTDAMQQKTLLLQGEFDDRRGLPTAISLHQQLLKRGIDSRLKIIPNGLHVLGPEKWDYIIPFLKENFFNVFGIGINLSKIGKAFQIAKILPESPAARSHLRVGDVILGISPENDATLLDAIEMTEHRFFSYVGGEKNTDLRLFVLHFDDTTEEIIIRRGHVVLSD